MLKSSLKVSSAAIKQLQKKVLSYYSTYGRNLPFRKTTNPYAILLSEVMLQQTQVERGIKYYEKWLTRWPTIEDLARASRVEVLKEWMGLGYNNRAKILHEAAQLISSQFEGDVLKALRSGVKIPGIGPYTNAAVRIFSSNEGIVTVDTNIRRILIHEFGLSEKVSDKELWELAKRCLPKGKSREWHNALMDFGATHLTSRTSGIRPKTRQSTFEGSDRQMRARVLRALLIQSLTHQDIEKLTSKTIKELSPILISLQRDGLILLKKSEICLKKQ